ncbi:MAG: 5'/3'-nucleotidase SurE [Clostridia bacterium]|nr:5'/3'-nucleotidase SurE [Clostridia bacterium]
MKILITNDDGIEARGIYLLTEWARKLGDVTVFAPKTEQSGKGQGIELHKPFEVKRADYPFGVRAFTVDSTPADCIRYALCGLCESFDLVLSGMNAGMNIGDDMAYSGTCGAAFEAAYFGVAAVAVSSTADGCDGAARHFDDVYRFFTEKDLFGCGKLYNVNIPPEPKGILLTRKGGPYYRDTFKGRGGDMYMAEGYVAHRDAGDFTLDTDAALNGYISVSPLTTDRTDHGVLEKLRRTVG